MKTRGAFALFLLFCFLSRQAAYSQDFASLDEDLYLLENLILDTISNTQEQQRLLDGLRTNLEESGSLIASYETTISEQENLLKELQIRLNEMSEIYQTQSSLSAKYEKSSRFWRTFTLIALPATALISGLTVYFVTR